VIGRILSLMGMLLFGLSAVFYVMAGHERIEEEIGFTLMTAVCAVVFFVLNYR